MSYTQTVLEDLKARYPEQTEFIQAATDWTLQGWPAF